MHIFTHLWRWFQETYLSLVRRAIEWLVQKKFSRAVIMVQEEFASKLRAKSGRDRKAVSVLACCAFDMRKISSVSRKNFDPPPSVESEILYLEQKRTISLETIHKINKIFSYRRKILSNIPGLGVKSDARLDDLSCEQIMEAAHATT